MDRYIKNVYNNMILENKGYMYISTEYIYFPIYTVSLEITKRKETKLNLVEEVVLKLISKEVTDIDEISNILGLDRSMLEITIADLHVKNLAYNTANKCIITLKGSESLKETKMSTKETDIIKNIYVDPIGKELIDLKSKSLIKKADSKSIVTPLFDGEDIEFYRKNISKIKEVFEIEIIKNYFDENTLPDELVSVDEINEINVSFFKIPVQIYLSDNGLDFDISTVESKYKDILEHNKKYIINEIIQHRLLSNIFSHRKIKEYNNFINKFNKNENIYLFMEQYFLDYDNKDKYYNELSKIVTKDRELKEEEVDELYYYLIKNAKTVYFYIDNLDNWSKDSKLLEMIVGLNKNCKYKIIYNTTYNKKNSKDKMNRTVRNLTEYSLKQEGHNNYFSVNIDNKYEIIVEVDVYNIIDNNTWIRKKKYYLKNIN